VENPTAHDPKSGVESANHFTQPAMHMVDLMWKEERFKPIKSELETIFELMGLHASRHSEIKQEEEKKILDLGLDLKVSCSGSIALLSWGIARLDGLKWNEPLLTLSISRSVIEA
jgi:hypothetical protein